MYVENVTELIGLRVVCACKPKNYRNWYQPVVLKTAMKNRLNKVKEHSVCILNQTNVHRHHISVRLDETRQTIWSGGWKKDHLTWFANKNEPKMVWFSSQFSLEQGIYLTCIYTLPISSRKGYGFRRESLWTAVFSFKTTSIWV